MTANQSPETTSIDSSVVAAPAKKSKVRRNLILAGSAAGLVGIGSTLAANINLNSGENVEFGQGVARTTACDEDGFFINPVTSYDNNLSIFRLDYVEITGLNLTPEGFGWDDSDLTGQYADAATAKAAHPGQYYDTNANAWKRTCDGIVLDFKAYTDDINYWNVTLDHYANNSPSISSPVAWAQSDGNNSTANFGFAVIFDINDDNIGELSNWGVAGSDSYGYLNWTIWESLDHSNPANSSFDFTTNTSSYDFRPNAASISKITVASMKTFPSNYNLDQSSGPGSN